MNILISGGSGFIGGYVYRHFKELGYSVKNFDLYGVEGDSDFLKGSILDFEYVKKIIVENKITVVFHFAGFSNINKVEASPRDCVDLNILGTTNILEAARLKGNTAVILASSVYVHSDHGHLYTTSKVAAERILKNYSELYNIKSNILRLGTVYGELSRHEDVISIFAKKISEKKPISVSGDGLQTRNFIHGIDVAKACEKILLKNIFEETLIISSEMPSSISEIVAYFKDLDSSTKVKFDKLVKRNDDYQGDVGDVDNTFRKLHWKPEIEIKEGIKRLYEFYQSSSE